MAKETNFQHPPRGHVAFLAYDSVNDRWQAIYVDASGNLQVDVVTLGELRNALHSVGTDELDVHIDGQASDVEVAQTTPADLAVAQHQYTGAAWVKSNLLWGYNAVWGEQQTHTKSAAGNYNLDSDAVPSGYVYVVKAVVSNNTDKTINHQHALVVNNYAIPILAPTSTTANVWRVTFPVDIALAEGDFVRVTFYNCDDGDDLYLRICGYKMKVDM